jgi:outer membrane protein
VRVQQANVEIATLEIERARAGHLPTLDLVGSFAGQATSGSSTTGYSSDSRSALLGLQLNVPLYQGGFVNSRVRESIALLDRSRADLETQRRAAITNAQDGFSGVNSAVAGIKAFEQAAVSADVALQSNILGQEVGIRTNLDVLNVRQNVYQARRDVANAYFTYLLASLRLKAATGMLTEIDLEELNRRLAG